MNVAATVTAVSQAPALDGGRRLTATANAGSGSYPGSNVLMADGDVLTWSTSRARCLAQYYYYGSSYPYDDGSSNCDSGSPGSPNYPQLGDNPQSDCDRGAYGAGSGACSGPTVQPKSLRAWRVCLNNNMWAALTGDPHLTGAHGDHADVKGADGGIYSLLSAPRLSVAVRFEHDDFKTPYSKQLIHGSWVRAAFWVVRLRAPNPAVVRVAYELSKMNLHRARASVVVLDGTSNNASQLAHLRLEVGGETFSRGELFVGLSEGASSKNPETRRPILTVRTAAWLTTAKATNDYPHGVTRMDVRVKTRSRAVLRPVAPHGLLGQTFDDDACRSTAPATTTRRRRRASWSTRRAPPAKGAIEGTIEEYRLPTPSPPSSSARASGGESLRRATRPRSGGRRSTRRWRRRARRRRRREGPAPPRLPGVRPAAAQALPTRRRPSRA